MARTFFSVFSGIILALALAFVTPASAVVPPLKQPTWAELSPQQREILAPLSSEWDKLESFRRKKWVGIAQRYPAMSAEEQQRLQLRMKTWVSLSPEERKQAREQYKALRKVPLEQRQTVNQKWQEYKNLPDAEKERLKQVATTRKTQPKSGASRVAPTPPPVAPATPPAAAASAEPATAPAPAVAPSPQ
ncbi:MAG: DUF3106 domain-containing protein [Betaproteobacteria bacterium]|nr:DUF3106 domain-containing protein [Betaproteobacteria bacterium]